ncbi:MAG TPA: hypothetical protein VHW23_43930 [Kofleriaceae bacterium]|nr:hypothetical protein [Kofleriaceae bacterium]
MNNRYSGFDLPLADPAAAAALASAARRARRYLVSRRMFRASVTGHEVIAEVYDRVLYNIEHRRLVVRSVSGGHGPLRPLPTPAGLDPWRVNPDTVEDDTRTVGACPNCQGAGTVSCPKCDGSTWARCPHCFGGKVLAQRKGQLLKNCPHCRGRGTQKCVNCHAGRVECPPCNATGRITGWLALERAIRSQVTVHPLNAASRIHRQIDRPDNFDSGAWPTRLSADTGLQPSLNVPDELAPALDPRAERVIGVRRQTFGTDVHKFHFATPVGGGTVDVAGEPPVVSPSSRWAGLRTRLALSVTIAPLGAGGIAAIHGDYVAQHPWYSQYGDVAPLLGFGAGAATLLGITAAFLMVARAARSWFAVGLSAGATTAFGLGVVLACTYNQPSLATATQKLAAGDLLRARDEAQALVDLHRDVAAAGAVLDDLHFRRARELRSIPDLVACIREPWHDSRGRAGAEAVLRTRVQETAVELFATHDTDRLGQLDNAIATVVPDMSQGLQWLTAAIRAGVLLASSDAAGASAQLEAVAKLADAVPAAMRPAEAPHITETATKLIAALAAVNSRSLKDRIKALTTAVGLAREYGGLVRMDANVVALALVRQQQQATWTLVRAERQAQQQNAARDSASQPPQQPPAAAVAGDPIDPYAAQGEARNAKPADAASGNEHDGR